MVCYKSNLIKVNRRKSLFNSVNKGLSLRCSATDSHTITPPFWWCASFIIVASLGLHREVFKSVTITFQTLVLSFGQSICRPSSCLKPNVKGPFLGLPTMVSWFIGYTVSLYSPFDAVHNLSATTGVTQGMSEVAKWLPNDHAWAEGPTKGRNKGY